MTMTPHQLSILSSEPTVDREVEGGGLLGLAPAVAIPAVAVIYMTDHLALGCFARELARRAQRAHDGTALGDALALVAEDGIAQDIAL